MAIVRPQDMDFSKQTFSAIIYGSPGMGKTTLALSAPKPVLIDFDNGVSRVAAAHRVPTIVCNTYEEVLADIDSPEMKEFETIVIDTGGSFVTYTISTVQSDSTFVEGDGYDCKLCMNRGDTLHLRETPTGFFQYSVPCKCMGIRRSIWRLKRSGLENSIREYTFKRFEVKEQWQQKMVDMAHRYLAEGVKAGRWLYIGGQPGCGKTHVCTAVAGKLLYEMPVIYAVWPQISKKLKALVNDAEDYGNEVGKLQEIDVLYFDDFFKPVTDGNGNRQPPTPADMKLAFEILNYRYINKKPTILSSEWYINELADMDEATASRIAERCGEFSMMVGRDRSRNHRFAMSTVV